MDRERFWAMVEAANAKAKGDEDAKMEILGDAVRALPVEEIVSFDRHFNELHNDAYRWNLWGAAYLIGGGCSDDGFMDFRGWLIAQGRAVYEAALADPKSLAGVVGEDQECQIEGYQYLANGAWEEATGEPADAFPFHDFGRRSEPSGDPWNDEDLPGLFPKLSEKFG